MLDDKTMVADTLAMQTESWQGMAEWSHSQKTRIKADIKTDEKPVWNVSQKKFYKLAREFILCSCSTCHQEVDHKISTCR